MCVEEDGDNVPLKNSPCPYLDLWSQDRIELIVELLCVQQLLFLGGFQEPLYVTKCSFSSFLCLAFVYSLGS